MKTVREPLSRKPLLHATMMKIWHHSSFKQFQSLWIKLAFNLLKKTTKQLLNFIDLQKAKNFIISAYFPNVTSTEFIVLKPTEVDYITWKFARPKQVNFAVDNNKNSTWADELPLLSALQYSILKWEFFLNHCCNLHLKWENFFSFRDPAWPKMKTFYWSFGRETCFSKCSYWSRKWKFAKKLGISSWLSSPFTFWHWHGILMRMRYDWNPSPYLCVRNEDEMVFLRLDV